MVIDRLTFCAIDEASGRLERETFAVFTDKNLAGFVRSFVDHVLLGKYGCHRASVSSGTSVYLGNNIHESRMAMGHFLLSEEIAD